jgi:hypothetical protein
MNDDQYSQEMAALFGPPAQYSDHKVNDRIRFNLLASEVEGLITWITGPGPSPTGKHHVPITYICSVPGELAPCFVYQSELIE